MKLTTINQNLCQNLLLKVASPCRSLERGWDIAHNAGFVRGCCPRRLPRGILPQIAMVRSSDWQHVWPWWEMNAMMPREEEEGTQKAANGPLRENCEGEGRADWLMDFDAHWLSESVWTTFNQSSFFAFLRREGALLCCREETIYALCGHSEILRFEIKCEDRNKNRKSPRPWSER